MKVKNCPVCGGNASSPLRGYEAHHLHTCRGCKFVFSVVIPTRKELDSIYGNYDYSTEIKTDFSLKKMRKIGYDLYQLNYPRNVLDVGCGSGDWLDVFKVLGARTFGTEYDNRLMRLAHDKGHTMVSGGLKPNLPGGAKVDLIIFTEVIEHILNPQEILGYFRQLLAEGGVIYLTTPNFASMERRVLKSQWGMICYPEHLSYYTPRTLHEVMSRAGFTRVSCDTENISLFRIIQALKKNGKTQADPTLMSNKAQEVINSRTWLIFAMRLANGILSSLSLGGSIVAVYRKLETRST